MTMTTIDLTPSGIASWLGPVPVDQPITTPVVIIHAGGCHLVRLPIDPSARAMALSGLAAGMERDQWGWERIEPAAVRAALVDHRAEEVILTDSESPHTALIAQGLDPLVLRLARAESRAARG